MSKGIGDVGNELIGDWREQGVIEDSFVYTVFVVKMLVMCIAGLLNWVWKDVVSRL